MKANRFFLTATVIVSLTTWQPAVGGAVSESDAKGKSTKKGVVAVFSLRGQITEAPAADDFPFGSSRTESLRDLISRMEKARDDKHVKGVVILLDGARVGSAQIEELRQVMDQIKAAGKEVHAHADSLSMGSYVLLSGASQLSVVPTGDIIITGLYGEQLYLRGMLDKIHVKPDFITSGAYKSAAEMFMRKGPSPEAKRMQSWLFDGIYETWVSLIAQGRNVPTEKVRKWIDEGLYSADAAKKAGIIDTVQFRQDFVAQLKSKYGKNVRFAKRYGKKSLGDVDFSSPFAVFKFWSDLFQGSKTRRARKNAVAIVYVDGPIVPGKGQPSPFGNDGIAYSTPIRRALDEVAEDKSVKAVVLRINSPGGSAVASEIILNATKQVKANKPFAVSMGNVAGSGGYYVACGADTIFADRSTITGSIGVVAGKLATTEMWNRLGIHWRPIGRGENAGLFSSYAVFTEEQREKLQGWMNEIYEVFKGHVQAIRGDRLKKDIEEIAGGRVYTGGQALELGLIDKIGGLDDAVGFVAKKAGIEDYDVRVVPRPKNFMEILLSDINETDGDSKTLSLTLHSPMASQSSLLLDAALPWLEGLSPSRVAAIKRALLQLDLLRHERAALMMPEIVVGY